jgi:tRNA nucleotidyltransferase/poly(A) polymerase
MERTMENQFARYLKLREEQEGKPVSGVTARIKLEKKHGSREFTPFIIDKNHHSNLAKVVAAFLNSDKVTLGYTTIDKNKGEVEPQLKRKSLYLTGGAVRDHLMGKTPNNYDLVTDATPSEIRMILKQNGFQEVKPNKIDGLPKYDQLASAGKKSNVFYASKWDKNYREMEFTAEVNGQPYSISTLSKSPKSKFHKPDEVVAASSIEEDAANRDFTINAMYIPLKNDDGPNNELIDPFGGANHLKNGEIKPIGNRLEDRMKEDPMTAMRFVNHFNRFGKGELPEPIKNTIVSHKDFSAPSCGCANMKDAFVGGLENPDVDPRKYMSSLHDTGLLEKIFPGIYFEPEEMPEGFKNDRWMATAWILRNNNPTDVREMLMNGGWTRQEANDISYLVKMYQWAGNNFDADAFYDVIQTHTGLTKGKIKEWMTMAKKDCAQVDQFLNFDGSDLNGYKTDDSGSRKVNPIYIKILGRNPIGGEFDSIKRLLLTNRWKDMTSPV